MKSITFRPTGAAVKSLAILMQDSGLKRSKVINSVLENAVGARVAVVDPGPVRKIVYGEGRTSPPPAGTAALPRPEASAKAEDPLKATAERPRAVGRPDPDKIDAFQRQMARSKK